MTPKEITKALLKNETCDKCWRSLGGIRCTAHHPALVDNSLPKEGTCKDFLSTKTWQKEHELSDRKTTP